jgi:small-conductance mechanosensitive channel
MLVAQRHLNTKSSMSRVFSSPTLHQVNFLKPCFLSCGLYLRLLLIWVWVSSIVACLPFAVPRAFLARKKHPMWLMVEIQTNKAKQAMSREKFELDNLLYDEIV